MDNHGVITAVVSVDFSEEKLRGFVTDGDSLSSMELFRMAQKLASIKLIDLIEKGHINVFDGFYPVIHYDKDGVETIDFDVISDYNSSQQPALRLVSSTNED